jgi:hypothetical protein
MDSAQGHTIDMDCKHVLTIDEGEHVCTVCGTVMGTSSMKAPSGGTMIKERGGRPELASQHQTFSLNHPTDQSCPSRGITSKDIELERLFKDYRAWSLSSNSQRSWMSIFDADPAVVSRTQVCRKRL